MKKILAVLAAITLASSAAIVGVAQASIPPTYSYTEAATVDQPLALAQAESVLAGQGVSPDMTWTGRYGHVLTQLPSGAWIDVLCVETLNSSADSFTFNGLAVVPGAYVLVCSDSTATLHASTPFPSRASVMY